jgi:DNA-nicking Smr family endonuclease
MEEKDTGPIQIPINGILDLHMFSPKDAASVVKEYIRSCLEKKIYEIRIIHGKGKGVLRETVHALLKKHPDVIEYKLDSGPSSWGATLVFLRNK